jgi:FKBP-type peptidyl-prolyl cis-trans isomerase 2
MPVKKGDRVKLEYEGSFEDGTVFETSEKDGKPLEFVVGSKQVIKGIEDAVLGMDAGQEKAVRIQPADAYGERSPDAVRKAPLKPEQKNSALKPGMSFLVNMPDGVELPVRIIDMDSETITIDLNHPLAGKTLDFRLKVIEVSS